MFIVKPMPEQISPELVAELEKCEVATIGHVLHSGFVDREIRAVLPNKRVAGTAVTLRIPHADSTLLHYLTAYVRPGDIVVVSPAASLRKGDRVIVKTREGEVLAKELVRRTTRAVELRSLNPEYEDRSLSAAEVL